MWLINLLEFCKTLLIVLLICFLLISVALYLIAYCTRVRQGDFLYYPYVADEEFNECVSPVTCGIAHSENIEIITSDGVSLRGYIIWPASSECQVSPLIPTLNEWSTSESPTEVMTTTSCDRHEGLRDVAVEGNGLMLRETTFTINTLNTGHNCTGNSNSNSINLSNKMVAISNANLDNSILQSEEQTDCNRSNTQSVTNEVTIHNVNNNTNNTNCSAGTANNSKSSSNNNIIISSEAAMKATTNNNDNTHTINEPNVLIYFHGNAGNVGHRIELAMQYVNYLHCAIMMVDYRGYGNSSPALIVQDGLEKDAEACLNYLHNIRGIPAKRIFVLGTSLGGAVAIHLASKEHNWRRIRGLIVENTFTSIADMVENMARYYISRRIKRGTSFYFYLFKYYLMPLTLMLRWDNLSRIHKIPIPILFLSAACDEIVPCRLMRKLFRDSQAAQHWRTLVTFARGTHNALYIEPNYMEYIYSFMYGDESKFNLSMMEHDIAPSTIVIE